MSGGVSSPSSKHVARASGPGSPSADNSTPSSRAATRGPPAASTTLRARTSPADVLSAHPSPARSIRSTATWSVISAPAAAAVAATPSTMPCHPPSRYRTPFSARWSCCTTAPASSSVGCVGVGRHPHEHVDQRRRVIGELAGRDPLVDRHADRLGWVVLRQRGQEPGRRGLSARRERTRVQHRTRTDREALLHTIDDHADRSATARLREPARPAPTRPPSPRLSRRARAGPWLNRKPSTVAVRARPPKPWLSSTTTDDPERAANAAAVSPANPPPTTTTSTALRSFISTTSTTLTTATTEL